MVFGSHQHVLDHSLNLQLLEFLDMQLEKYLTWEPVGANSRSLVLNLVLGVHGVLEVLKAGLDHGALVLGTGPREPTKIKYLPPRLNPVDMCVKNVRKRIQLQQQIQVQQLGSHNTRDRRLQVEVFRKPTHTDQYLLFDSHHPLQHKLGVIRTLHHRAQVVPTSAEGKEKEEQHVEKALSVCGDPKWAFNKTKRAKKQDNREPEKLFLSRKRILP